MQCEDHEDEGAMGDQMAYVKDFDVNIHVPLKFVELNLPNS